MRTAEMAAGVLLGLETDDGYLVPNPEFFRNGAELNDGHQFPLECRYIAKILRKARLCLGKSRGQTHRRTGYDLRDLTAHPTLRAVLRNPRNPEVSRRAPERSACVRCTARWINILYSDSYAEHKRSANLRAIWSPDRAVTMVHRRRALLQRNRVVASSRPGDAHR